jgi:phosphatidylethanolamine-binding protein (PEBP) family uncharacterized protein
VAEYVLVVEDPDAPLPTPPLRGLVYAIPGETTTRITAADMELQVGAGAGGRGQMPPLLKGEFRAVKNILGKHYGGLGPPLGDGPYRYFYQLVAVGEKVEWGAKPPLRAALAEALAEKVLGWGLWVGVYEKEWRWEVRWGTGRGKVLYLSVTRSGREGESEGASDLGAGMLGGRVNWTPRRPSSAGPVEAVDTRHCLTIDLVQPVRGLPACLPVPRSD